MLLPLPEGGANCQYAYWRKRNRATSLIINALILMAITQNAAAITASTRTAANFQGNYEDAARVSELSPASGYGQNYYRTQAADASAVMSPTYADYVGNTRATAITHDQVQHLHLGGESTAAVAVPATTNGFMPTTMTAAGQHYVAAAGGPVAAVGTRTMAEASAVNIGADSGGVGYAATKGKFNYDISENSENYDDDNEEYATYDVAATTSALEDLSAVRSGAEGVGNTYFDGRSEAFKNYFTPTTYQPHIKQYLRNYDIEQFANYQHQQQQQQPRQLHLQLHHQQQQQQQQQQQHQPHAIYDDNSALLQRYNKRTTIDNYDNGKQQIRHLFNYAKQPQQQQRQHQHQHQRQQQQQQEQHQSTAAYVKHAQQTAARNQLQLQVQLADRAGRSVLTAANNFEADGISNSRSNANGNVVDNLESESQYYYAHNNDLGDGHSGGVHQHQQHHLSSTHSLPPITNTVHHTPTSSAAVAGIPLGKHTHVTKHVPVANYQQLQVPYQHMVPIEIPRPIITTIKRPIPIHVPITKTVAVPQLKEVKIPIEKVKPYPVERPVPFIVERRVPYRVEKQVATPVYYPYPIKVPIVRTVVHKLPSHHHHHHRQHYNTLPHVTHGSGGYYTSGHLG